jgi:cell division protein FtsB
LEFNFDDPNRSQSTSDSISSDRLRKAIERNRAKQAKRAASAGGASSRGTVDLSSASSRTSSSERSGFTLPGRGRRATAGTASSASSMSASSSTRRNVGRAGEQEFATSVRRNVQKAPADVSYVSKTPASRATRSRTATTTVVPAKTTRTTRTTRSTTTRRKISAKAEKRTRYFVMACWVLLGVMCLRLVFSRGGVIDFYANKGLLEGKVEEYQSIQVENKTLLKEIKKIRSSKSYQKKLVRDHLGFIAKDEFLILFSKEDS